MFSLVCTFDMGASCSSGSSPRTARTAKTHRWASWRNVHSTCSRGWLASRRPSLDRPRARAPARDPAETGRHDAHRARGLRGDLLRGRAHARGPSLSRLVYRERPATGEPTGLLVLHHGRGADEHDLLGLGDVLDPE